MNRSRKTSASPLTHPANRPPPPSKSTGFTLVEVMVTALILSVGLLGMATLQGRTLSYTSETTQRSTAAMMANDLLEQVRAAPAQWSSLLDSAHAPQAELQRCTTTPGKPDAQLACWLADVAILLPSSTQLPAGHTYICRSPSPGTCANTGSTIEVQVAWKGSLSECLNAQRQCHYRVRSEI